MPIDYTKRPKQPEPSPQSSPQSSPPQGGGVSLSKVTLTKAAPAVSLTKQGSAGGRLRVNLNWTARPEGQQPAGGGGFLKRLTGAASGSGAIDLDLGCLYEYTDGSKGVVQALGGAFRDEHTLGPDPICSLDGDDRSGSSSGGENLYVDLRHLAAIKRILVFAFIYEGTPNWSGANGVVTLFPASGPQVEMRLDDSDPASRMCAIALLENSGGELVVRREVRYLGGGQKLLDQTYGWGMNWTPGRK